MSFLGEERFSPKLMVTMAFPYPYPGPVPAFNNLPIEPQNYNPWRFVISGITLGVTTTVTMVIPAITVLNYVIGQVVRLLIPQQAGCRLLNGMQGEVIAIPSATQVIVNINSLGSDPFIVQSSPNQPQILAIGDVNTGSINSMGRINNGTFTPGSFINVSF